MLWQSFGFLLRSFRALVNGGQASRKRFIHGSVTWTHVFVGRQRAGGQRDHHTDPRSTATNRQAGFAPAERPDSRATGWPLPSSANVNQCKCAIIGASANLYICKFALPELLQK